MRIRLTPNTATAGGTRYFEVVGANLRSDNGELTLACRDGYVCIQLVGQWEYTVEYSLLAPMSCEEVERIHDGRSLVTLATSLQPH